VYTEGELKGWRGRESVLENDQTPAIGTALFACFLIFVAAFGAWSGSSHSSDWWLTWFTGGLVIVGGLQLFLFLWQLRLIRDSLVDAKHAADAARQSADAANDSVRLAKETAQKELRAYINYDSARMENWNSSRPIVRAVFKNFGDTPAYAVTYEIALLVGDGTLEKNFPKDAIYSKKSLGVVGPNTPITMSMGLDDARIAQIKKLVEGKGGIVFVSGRIDYDDCFRRERRWTTFRLAYNHGAASGDDLSICESGNDAN
jgi:hypothetical protein